LMYINFTLMLTTAILILNPSLTLFQVIFRLEDGFTTGFRCTRYRVRPDSLLH